MKRTNTVVTLSKLTDNGIEYFTHKDVTKLALGYRVLYLEYLENECTRIRAYGRKEFNNVSILNAQNEVSNLILSGPEFTRVDALFPILEDDDSEINCDAEMPEKVTES